MSCSCFSLQAAYDDVLERLKGQSNELLAALGGAPGSVTLGSADETALSQVRCCCPCLDSACSFLVLKRACGCLMGRRYFVQLPSQFSVTGTVVMRLVAHTGGATRILWCACTGNPTCSCIGRSPLLDSRAVAGQ
jgi:hypothetical protein